VEHYQNVMNVLLKAVHTRHKDHAKNVKDALTCAAGAVFNDTMKSMWAFEPGEEGTHEEKIRFNDSVSRLRTVHNQTLLRIRTLTNKPKEEVHEPVSE
jgi:hypothetical protein